MRPTQPSTDRNARPRRLAAALLALTLGACATVVTLTLDKRFGPADPSRFDTPPLARPTGSDIPDYRRDVRPILDARCVSCHACYDAPCQLNLANYDGLTRGASSTSVYANRLLAIPPTRLGIDADRPSAWRKLGFHSVLNERTPSPEANRAGGVLYRLLEMKQREAVPPVAPLRNPDLDFSLDRAEICVRDAELDAYSREHPGRGMPFGLPALSRPEHDMLARWLEAGAPYRAPSPLPTATRGDIQRWENFLNGDSLKEQLAARYLYEHWYIGHLNFASDPERYFELVRSATPPGQPVQRIITRRPFDAPGVDRVYYRLLPIDATPVAKTFMPLRLDAARMERVRGWLLTGDPVYSLPDYDPKNAANPFLTFRDLPLEGRYRVMLDDAQFTVMGYMKGPVCRGQVALNVINDHFWILFLQPNPREMELQRILLDEATPVMRLPAAAESYTGLLAWREFSRLEAEYTATKHKIVDTVYARGPAIDESVFWNGDGSNPNAALTVFRHFDSASVVRGLVGDTPQTVMVMGYPLLERMHYLLVAGYDLFGTVGHGLNTRLYMDFLRMEGELNFLILLPKAERQKVLEQWYRGRETAHREHFVDMQRYFNANTGIRFKGSDPLGELYARARQRVAAVRPPALDWQTGDWPAASRLQLQELSRLRGLAAAEMPEDSLLAVRGRDGRLRLASLIRNSAHTNVAQLFNEDKRRIPEEDTLLAINGVVGAYPNALFVVDEAELPRFTTAIRTLAGDDDRRRLVDRWGIRRSDPRFWPTSDAIHAEWRRIAPGTAAILDYSRLAND